MNAGAEIDADLPSVSTASSRPVRGIAGSGESDMRRILTRLGLLELNF
jgi:hypothetical protein